VKLMNALGAGLVTLGIVEGEGQEHNEWAGHRPRRARLRDRIRGHSWMPL